MGASNCACLDRDKEKERQKVQNEFQAQPPIQKMPGRPSAIESYLNDKRRSNQYTSNKSTNEKSGSHNQMYGSQALIAHPQSEYISVKTPRSHLQPAISKPQIHHYLSSHDASQSFSILSIKYHQLKDFLKSSKDILVDQIFPNPFMFGETMIVIRSSRDNLLLQDLEIHEQTFSCKQNDVCKLYFVLKCFLCENAHQYIGYYVLYDRGNITLKVYVRKLNQKLAKYINLELQTIDILTPLQVEEVVNERIQDSIMCLGMISIFGDDKRENNILVLKQFQRQINNISIIQLEEKQVNKTQAATDISKKINMLCTNDDFELVGLIPDLRNRSVLIMMSHQ